MVCGDADHFHYRSSYITEFFQKCDLDKHDGTTRPHWVTNLPLPRDALPPTRSPAEFEDDDIPF